MANLLLPAPGGAPRLVYGWDGTDWRALLVDAAGNLQVDVAASALPAGAATAAHQVTMITALQLIDDLRNALDSVEVDELRVVRTGTLLAVALSRDTVGGDSYLLTATVPAGEEWIVTNIHLVNWDAAGTRGELNVFKGATDYPIVRLAAPGANVGMSWQGEIPLTVGEAIRSRYHGGGATDHVALTVLGYKYDI